MCGFDKYINAIIGGLGISGKRKRELEDEFKDHLNLLKSEYVNNGFSENEAMNKAMDRFGEWSDIQMKLEKSLANFRNPFSTVFGVIITLAVICFCCLPIYGVTVAFSEYKSFAPMYELINSEWYILSCALLFIPIGYFLPIILNRAYKVLQWILIYSVLGIAVGACFAITPLVSISPVLLFTCFAAVLAGSMAGYGILVAINKLHMLRGRSA